MATTETKALQLKNAAGEMVTYDYGDAAGVGMALASEGGMLPFLELLQGNSKIITEDVINGAKVGMFAIKSAKLLFDGKAGVNFIGAFEVRKFVEWTPRDKGGGFVAEYDPTDPIVLKAQAAATQKFKLKTDAGNDLVETYRWYGFIVDDWADIATPEKLTAVVVSFDKTKTKARNSIMERMRKNKGLLPLFAAKLRLSSVLEKNKRTNDPFQNYALKFAVNDDLLGSLIPPNAPEWANWKTLCMKLAADAASGKIKAEAPAHSTEGDGEGGEDPPF